MDTNKISIAEVLADAHISISDTVYDESNTEMLNFQIVSRKFYEPLKKANGKYSLIYKNTVEIADYRMITELLPPLSDLNYSGKAKLPYFISGLDLFRKALDDGKRSAVEGGPCLFGTNEVIVNIFFNDGTVERFDFNSGKPYSLSSRDEDLGEFLLERGADVSEIKFENKKTELTPQEWIFIKYPFDIAKLLQIPLVIPIPDMSYAKYMDAVLVNAPESVRNKALCDFRALTDVICDKYLSVIKKLCEMYSDVHCDVVHARNDELISKYYEARTPFIERGKTLRSLTKAIGKTESVKDYISMPALPYYLYGAENILEVDSMDETDSYRKCRKAHKNAFNLSCILLPEFLSKDMVHTIFDAPLNRKEYGNYVID